QVGVAQESRARRDRDQEGPGARLDLHPVRQPGFGGRRGRSRGEAAREPEGSQEVNLVEELRALDPSDPGRWPLPIRIGTVVLWFVVLAIVLAYVFVWKNQRPELQRYQAEETRLRGEFRNKHSKAVNLEVYKQQLADIERSFGALLRQLP